MATIRRATSSDVPAIAAYLSRALAGGGPERYRRYLDYSWLADKPDRGVLLEHDGHVCGFIGAIYAERTTAGQVRRFCNINSVAVDEAHRKHTLKLFAAALAAKDVTYTCFSASEQIAKILDFFKFDRRPSDKVVVGPISSLGRAWSSRRTEVIASPADLDAALEPDERAISRAHRPYRCGQVLLVHGDRRCFVVTVRRGRGARAFADVLHASDPDLLMEHLPRIHLPLFRAHHTVLTGIDRRWVRAAPRASFAYTKLRPIYMRSPVMTIDGLDALYSELVPMYG